MTTHEEFLASLDKDTRKNIKIASDVVIERQPLPSIGITRELQGGLRYGAEHLFWGPTGSGKTMAAYETLALAQKAGKVCALVDAEGAFTAEWGEKLGIKTDELIIITGKNMEKITNQCKDLVIKGLDFLLIDSISSLLAPAYWDEKGGIKDAGTTNRIGDHARGCVTMLNILNGANTGNTLILYISQQTTNITTYGGVQQPHGGNKFKHEMTTVIKFGTNMSEKHRITDDVTEGDIILSRVTGRPVDWFIEKERGPGMHMRGTYNIFFAGDYVGIDQVSELVDYGVRYGIIKKGGAWLTIFDEQVQGRDNAISYVRNNQEIRDTLEALLVTTS